MTYTPLTSMEGLIVWLKPYAERKFSIKYLGYEEGRRDGQTDMARGVLEALKQLGLDK